MKIWLDDLRLIPLGYTGTKSVNETIRLIEEAELKGETIEIIDTDSYDESGWKREYE